MDESLLVGMIQTLGGLSDVVGDQFKIDRPLVSDHPLQVLAIDVFHHDVVDVLVRIDVVGPYDVLVVQPSDRLGLLLETGQVRRVAHFAFGQDLDCHAAAHDHVVRQIHAAHPPRTEVPQQLVIAQEESLVATLQQLVALPPRNQLGLNQMFGDLGRVLRQFAAGLSLQSDEGFVELFLVLNKPATLNEFEKFFYADLWHAIGDQSGAWRRRS